VIRPEDAERFRAELTALTGGAVPVPIAVAVSGGPDSMALLALAAATGPTIAATVDHRLRPASADEAAMVARWCAAAGVAHTTLVPPPDWAPRSIQADAREMRYALLGDWAAAGGAGALLTAHHADDQAETFVMRATRGSGVAGLGGIRPRRAAGAIAILRPLLGWRRARLRALAEGAGLPFVDDPSNADDRYDRTRVRRWLADAPFDAAALARSAAACAAASEALDAVLPLLRRDRMRGEDDLERSWEVEALPRELRRRIVRESVAHVRDANRIAEGRCDAATDVEGLLSALEAGGSATLAGVSGSARGTVWRFRAAPPRRSR